MPMAPAQGVDRRLGQRRIGEGRAVAASGDDREEIVPEAELR